MARRSRAQWYDDFIHQVTRKTFTWWERVGLHVTPNHFYQPIPDSRTLAPELWSTRSDLVGVDMNEQGQLALLDRIAGIRDEFGQFPTAPTGDPQKFHLNNSNFDFADAQVLYALIRLLRPGRILEIGSGYSTLVATEALAANRADGHDGILDAIEPYPRPFVRNLPGLSRLIEHAVQDVPLQEFENLTDGDVLFIDSTHVLRIGSDVQYEYLEILPRLAPGVLVHVHDIFLPEEYPRSWVMARRWFWTEQYLLQAFLAFNKDFEVLWAGNWMRCNHGDRLISVLPHFDPAVMSPGSFWMRRLPAR